MTRATLTILSAWLALVTSGCATPSRHDADVPTPLDRPSALRRLDAFVGHWRVHGTARHPGNPPPVALAGETDVHWEGELLVARGRTATGGADSLAMSIITYDPRAGVYRSTVISPDGAVGTAETVYDERESRWRGRMDSIGPDGAATWIGDIVFTDANTKREHWVGRSAARPQERIVIDKTETRIDPP